LIDPDLELPASLTHEGVEAAVIEVQGSGFDRS
jgi:hypothetical protein